MMGTMPYRLESGPGLQESSGEKDKNFSTEGAKVENRYRNNMIRFPRAGRMSKSFAGPIF